MSREERDSLPDSWKLVALGEIGRWYGGGTPSKANPSFWTDGKIPWVSPKDMKADRIHDSEDHITEEAVERSATNLIPKGSVLIVTRSGILRHTLPVAVSAVDCAINQDLKALSPFEGIEPEYVAYALKASASRVLTEAAKGGTTVQSIESPKLLRYEIPLAPTLEQRRVVAEVERQLSRVEVAVESLKHAQANLKRYRAAVLKAACEGHLTATGPLLASNQGLPWPIPRRWRWVKAEEISHFITKGTTPAANSLTKGYGEIPFIKVQNLTFNGSLDVSINRSFIPKSVHNSELRRSIVFPGDVLMNIVGPPLGKVALVPTTYPEWNINQAIARFRPKEGIKAAFLSLVLQNNATLRWAERRAKATAGQFNLTLEICRELPVPVPPEEEQVDIVAVAERHLTIIDSLSAVINRSLVRASNLRQALLRQAFEGVLVPQDPNDEPASILLEKIGRARVALGQTRPLQRG